jgi:GGDEF domain-containing protein
MELVDMKLPEKSKEETKDCCAPCCGDQEKYPWGLQLRFEKEQVEKLPSLKEYKVGEKVKIIAEAIITEISIRETVKDDENYRVELQIEKIACEPVFEKSPEEMSIKEYRKMREVKNTM